MRALTVTNPFQGYALGDQITDPNEVKEILAGEHSGHVNQVILADKPKTKE